MVNEPRSLKTKETGDRKATNRALPTASATRTRSFLVRFWAEAREVPGANRRVRGYATHLATGDECYFADPQALTSWFERVLQEEFGEATADEGAAAGDE